MKPTVPGILTPRAPILILGQAPGAQEVKYGRPFIGPAGRELDRWLAFAGVERFKCAITNVFNCPIPSAGLAAMTASTREAKAEGWTPELPPILRGRHLRPEWHAHLARLHLEILEVQPNVILALGDQALWALSGHFGIETRRGALFQSLQGPKAIATYHPAYILRGQWKRRIPAMADVVKAKRESASPVLTMTERELHLSPTLEDLHSATDRLLSAELLSVDIETAAGEITSIAFAPSPNWAICVPFVLDGRRSYWPTLEAEIEAWQWVKRICESPVPKLLQNGLYDAQWLWVKRGIALRRYAHDTRLAHHALFPELPKSLGFMGSLWENEGAWKQLGGASRKRDD